MYAKNGATVFKTEVSENKITAVCADDNKDYFYVGDDQGNLYSLNKKGEILKSGSMPEKISGAVLSIGCIASSDPSFLASSSKGKAYFHDVTTEMRVSTRPNAYRCGSTKPNPYQTQPIPNPTHTKSSPCQTQPIPNPKGRKSEIGRL